jgi:hypothetical protein
MSEQLEILNKIENGEISPEEGARMLEELSSGGKKVKAADALDQMSILNRIESGEISPEEGIRLLQSEIEGIEIIDPPSKRERINDDFPRETPPRISEEEMNKWKNWWTYPLYFGIGVTVLSAYWMNSAYQNSGYGFWFFCSWLPLLVGVALMALSWHSQGGTWLHVRVNSKRQRVAISLPLPLGLTAFIFRNFGHLIPHMNNTSLDEIIVALKETTESGSPFHVHVDEGEDGEQVEVFIG